ncbi:hypothetical protein [Arthrobacter sp. ISL-69]|uniref:hypothetical protein n=1 Tax=Arthrobacter sp. ISL-69 TaxID=2819113 RepID=UPI001BE51601|nr:hypothetical protein [Arthrobacter sp. ISL-69]MBT2536077.1 hypothetical protein [Arthrobacter sp. ISL-69]
MTIVSNAPVVKAPPRASNSPRHPARPGARALEPMPNWTKLSRKDDVEIYRGGELVASGRVDMLALDGSVFWVVRNDGQGRAMFLHSDGFTVLRLPRARPVD